MSGKHKKSLTDKRKRFIAEYLKDLNATRAAERAGYKQPNMAGPRMVNDSTIRNEIDRQLRLRVMTPEEVLERLTDQAKADYSSYITDSGKIDLPSLLADGKGHLIKGTKWDRYGHLVVDFYDGQKALSLMAKHQGLLNDTTTNINIDLGSLTTEQLERIANGEDPVRVMASASGSVEPNSEDDS